MPEINFYMEENPPLDRYFINITPAPILIRLKGLDDGMPCFMEMPGGVFILRIVAAANMTADEAQSQVDPAFAGCQAFFTSLGARLHLLDQMRMGAFFIQGSFLLSRAVARRRALRNIFISPCQILSGFYSQFHWFTTGKRI